MPRAARDGRMRRVSREPSLLSGIQRTRTAMRNLASMISAVENHLEETTALIGNIQRSSTNLLSSSISLDSEEDDNTNTTPETGEEEDIEDGEVKKLYLDSTQVTTDTKIWVRQRFQRLATISPLDAMVIARHIVRASQRWDTRPTNAMGNIPGNPGLREVENAVLICKRANIDQITSQKLLSYFYLAQQYQSAIVYGGVDKAEMDRLLKARSELFYVEIGLKIHTLAYCLSPQSMVGLSILPLMHLDLNTIASLNEGKMTYLCALFTQQQWTSEQLGITKDEAAQTEYIALCLIPAVEMVIVHNLTNGTHAFPWQMIHYDSTIDGTSGYGLKISFPRREYTTPLPRPITVRMSPAQLIDERLCARPEDSSTVHICGGSIHLDLHQHMNRKSQLDLSAALGRSLWRYDQFWYHRRIPAMNFYQTEEIWEHDYWQSCDPFYHTPVSTSYHTQLSDSFYDTTAVDRSISQEKISPIMRFWLQCIKTSEEGLSPGLSREKLEKNFVALGDLSTTTLEVEKDHDVYEERRGQEYFESTLDF